MSTHTPTPWQAFEFGGEHPAIGIKPETWAPKIQYWIASVPLRRAPGAGASIQDCGATTDEARANAEFIVRAVNSHDRLVKALRRAVNHLLMDGTHCNDVADALTQCQAALAAAEGKE